MFFARKRSRFPPLSAHTRGFPRLPAVFRPFPRKSAIFREGRWRQRVRRRRSIQRLQCLQLLDKDVEVSRWVELAGLGCLSILSGRVLDGSR